MRDWLKETYMHMQGTEKPTKNKQPREYLHDIDDEARCYEDEAHYDNSSRPWNRHAQNSQHHLLVGYREIRRVRAREFILYVRGGGWGGN